MKYLIAGLMGMSGPALTRRRNMTRLDMAGSWLDEMDMSGDEDLNRMFPASDNHVAINAEGADRRQSADTLGGTLRSVVEYGTPR